MGLQSFLHRKLVNPLIDLLKQGITPEALALSIACGITGGMFPIPATTTFVCSFFLIAFRLNLIATQVANFFITPVKYSMILPFVRMGERMLGIEPIPLLATDLIHRLKADRMGTLRLFWDSILGAILVWAIFVAVATPAIYFVLTPVFRKLKNATTTTTTITATTTSSPTLMTMTPPSTQTTITTTNSGNNNNNNKQRKGV